MKRFTDGNGDVNARVALAAALLIWLGCAAITVWVKWSNITLGTFNDPDDAMRLVEVRDWMAGQSWFDVTQYRTQPPLGGPMHWSRLVDLPIAAIIAVAARFLPMACAEQVAVVAVPLLLLALLYAVVYRLAVELSGRRLIGLVSLVLLSLSIGTLLQFYPTRIDHHGWQILLGGLAVLMLVQSLKGYRHRALLAGLAMALALVIAIEGLPLAVAIGGVFGLLHWRDGTGADRLLAYLTALTAGAALLSLATLGWPAVGRVWCDALSPAYLWPMATALVLLAGGLRLIPQRGAVGRLATLALAGAGAALVFRLSTPLCAAGPFASLDPLVYRLWYLSVMEGRPVWAQSPDVQVILLTPSILGIVAVLGAIRHADADRRDPWLAMLVIQGVTFLVSITVMRAMGLAHLVALPACAWLFLHLFLRTRTLATPVARTVAGSLCVLATPIGLEAAFMATLPAVSNSASDKATLRRSRCVTPVTIRGLAAMPRAILFTPLDIGPDILVYTPHIIVATGHHRARQGMRAVVSAFTSPPEQARRIILGTPATHLALCMGENEVRKYAKVFPASLTARLVKGTTPDWLQPVPMRPGEFLHVYRILRPAQRPAQAGEKRIATPFIQ